MTVVTNKDREAAAAFILDQEPDATWNNEGREVKILTESILLGQEDNHHIAQAFAAHREEAVRELTLVTERLLSALSPLNVMGKPIASLDSALSEAIRNAVIALANHKGDE